MDAWIDWLITAMSLPQVGLSTVFFIAFIAATSGSFCSSAEPAATLQTFFAGHPMLMSMICAPRTTL